MYTASLIHVETATEYYENEIFINPSANQKLAWELYGIPTNIKKDVKTFETIIDEFTGHTKKEIESKVNENFKNGAYNYLPSMGCNSTIDLRYNINN